LLTFPTGHYVNKKIGAIGDDALDSSKINGFTCEAAKIFEVWAGESVSQNTCVGTWYWYEVRWFCFRAPQLKACSVGYFGPLSALALAALQINTFDPTDTGFPLAFK
jgi:hypothetical protein